MPSAPHTRKFPIMSTTVRRSPPRGKKRAAPAKKTQTGRSAPPKKRRRAPSETESSDDDTDSSQEGGSDSSSENGSTSASPDGSESAAINEWHVPSDDERIDERKGMRENLPRPDLPITIYGLDNIPMRFMPYLRNIMYADIYAHSGCCAHCPHRQWADGSLSEPVEVRCDGECRASHGAGMAATSLGPPPAPPLPTPAAAEPAFVAGVPASARPPPPHPFDGDVSDLTDDEDEDAPLASARDATNATDSAGEGALLSSRQGVAANEDSRMESAESVIAMKYTPADINAPRASGEPHAWPAPAISAAIESALAEPEQCAAPRDDGGCLRMESLGESTASEANRQRDLLEHAHAALNTSLRPTAPSDAIAASTGSTWETPQRSLPGESLEGFISKMSLDLHEPEILASCASADHSQAVCAPGDKASRTEGVRTLVSVGIQTEPDSADLTPSFVSEPPTSDERAQLPALPAHGAAAASSPAREEPEQRVGDDGDDVLMSSVGEMADGGAEAQPQPGPANDELSQSEAATPHPLAGPSTTCASDTAVAEGEHKKRGKRTDGYKAHVKVLLANDPEKKRKENDRKRARTKRANERRKMGAAGANVGSAGGPGQPGTAEGTGAGG